MTAPPPTYHPRWTRRLHWWSATLILVLWPVGLCTNLVNDEAMGDALLRTHLVLGLAVFAMTIGRWLVRLRGPRVPLPPELTGWQRRLAGAVHLGLPVVQLVVVALGLATWRASGAPLAPWDAVAADLDLTGIADELHGWTAHLLMVLFVTHFAGVVFHDSMHPGSMDRMRRRGEREAVMEIADREWAAG